MVGPEPEGDGGYVEGVGDEVEDVPHVAEVLPGPHVPQLLDLAPDESWRQKQGNFAEKQTWWIRRLRGRLKKTSHRQLTKTL